MEDNKENAINENVNENIVPAPPEPLVVGVLLDEMRELKSLIMNLADNLKDQKGDDNE